jgi:hypothetical protein
MRAQPKPVSRFVFEAIERAEVTAKANRVLGPDGKPVTLMVQPRQTNHKSRRILRIGSQRLFKHLSNKRGKKKHQIADPLARYLIQRDAEALALLAPVDGPVDE